MILAALAAAATIQPRATPAPTAPPCARIASTYAWRPSPTLVRMNTVAITPRGYRVITTTLLHHGEPVLRESVSGIAPGGRLGIRYYQDVAADASGLAIRMRIGGSGCRAVQWTRKAG